MKAVVKRAIKDEKGAALALALVLLVVGGLILTPLLGLMSTGLIAGQVYEKKTDELYAADAGVEDAIWRIQTNTLTFVNNSSGPWHLTVNGRNVTVEVYREDMDPTPCGMNFTYQILSTAATDDGGGTAAIGSSTTVEAHVEPLVFDLLAGALVSKSDITFKSDAHPCNVTGDVYYVGAVYGDYIHSTGDEKQIPLDAFPDEEQNEAFAQQFKEQALLGGTYDGTMNIGSDTTLGPTYITGDLYVENDVTIGLNGTIYVEGSITAKKDYTITGSGSIVAVGNIYLSKLANYGIQDDTVIMSCNGDIVFKKDAIINAFVYAPNGAFAIYKNITVLGGLIGASIEVKKDGSFTYVSKGSSFGFFAPVTYGAKIRTYTINPLD